MHGGFQCSNSRRAQRKCQRRAAPAPHALIGVVLLHEQGSVSGALHVRAQCGGCSVNLRRKGAAALQKRRRCRIRRSRCAQRQTQAVVHGPSDAGRQMIVRGHDTLDCNALQPQLPRCGRQPVWLAYTHHGAVVQQRHQCKQLVPAGHRAQRVAGGYYSHQRGQMHQAMHAPPVVALCLHNAQRARRRRADGHMQHALYPAAPRHEQELRRR